MSRGYGNHIKTWKKYNGEIPKDSDGRSYEIHHIDGNPENNNIENLMCVSINEHYKIHVDQGDYNAAFLIAGRMITKPEDISKIASEGSKQRIKNGTHNFLDPNFPRSLDHNIGYVVALDTRTDNIVRITKEEFDVCDYYVGVNTGRKHKIVHNNRGHNKGKSWKQTNKEQPKKCKYCGFEGRASLISRWHNERCKYKNESEIN